MILARNIDCRSKTLKQFGPVASKYERKSRYKSIFQCISLRRQVCVCRPIWFSRVFCSVWLFTVETSSCFLKSSLEFNSHRGQPKCIGVLVSSPIDQSFCSVLRPRNNNLQANCTVVVVVFFFLHMAADIMLNMLSNTLLNNTIQYVKQQKNKRKNKARTFTMMLAVGRPTSS